MYKQKATCVSAYSKHHLTSPSPCPSLRLLAGGSSCAGGRNGVLPRRPLRVLHLLRGSPHLPEEGVSRALLPTFPPCSRPGELLYDLHR